jgi:predicted dehydrogenase
LHVPLATRLAAAGIHLLIEKPLSTSLDGIEDLVRNVAQQNIVAAVAYVHRANPNLAAARQAIQSGRFGRPVQLTSVTGANFPFYRPAYRDTYYRDRAHGGGAIQDALTHLINAGQWLIGPVERVLADAAHQVIPGVEVEDTVHVLARQQGIPAATGMVDIKSFLLAHGVSDVAGWQLTVGAAISADGHTLAGTGFSPAGRSEAWVATIPEPATFVLALCGAIAGAILLSRRNANRGQVPDQTANGRAPL